MAVMERAERTTSFVDSSHLTVAMPPASELSQPGTATLVGKNPGSARLLRFHYDQLKEMNPSGIRRCLAKDENQTRNSKRACSTVDVDWAPSHSAKAEGSHSRITAADRPDRWLVELESTQMGFKVCSRVLVLNHTSSLAVPSARDRSSVPLPRLRSNRGASSWLK